MTDFFISYTGVDRAWAEWIAWQLEAAGYTVVLQAQGKRIWITLSRLVRDSPDPIRLACVWL
jgi:hypothetical protein